MAVNYIVNSECNAKRALGDGDHLKGTVHILALLKARDRAAALRDMATRDGRSPEGMAVIVRTVNADGSTAEKSVTYEDLLSQASGLEPYTSACSGCQANFLSKPFGCFGVLNFPVCRGSEEWLMSRLQPITTIGGQLIMAAVKDFRYTGESIKTMRAAGLFESSKPIKRAFKTGFLLKFVITSDQLFETILSVGEYLDPGHCMGILLWLGAIRLDGTIPTSPAEVEAISELTTTAQRTERTTLELGPATNHPAILAMHSLLRGLFTSWTQSAAILISD